MCSHTAIGAAYRPVRKELREKLERRTFSTGVHTAWSVQLLRKSQFGMEHLSWILNMMLSFGSKASASKEMILFGHRVRYSHSNKYFVHSCGLSRSHKRQFKLTWFAALLTETCNRWQHSRKLAAIYYKIIWNGYRQWKHIGQNKLHLGRNYTTSKMHWDPGF